MRNGLERGRFSFFTFLFYFFFDFDFFTTAHDFDGLAELTLAIAHWC